MRMTRISAAAQKHDRHAMEYGRCPGATIDPTTRDILVDRESECFKRLANAPRSKSSPASKPTKTKGGPGTELKALFASLGIDQVKDCGCGWKAFQMDQRGVEWCKANREHLLTWLRAKSGKYNWTTRALAAMNAVKLGYAIHPSFMRDPLAWLLDEAIRLSEQDQSGKPVPE